MYSEMLLATGWTLEAQSLPERLMPEVQHSGFSLPGASALADFGDLLGQDAPAPQEDASEKGVPFSLPALFPEEVHGWAALSREIDFGRLCSEHASLEIDPLCGSGCIELGGRQLLRFGTGVPCAALDLTDALRLGRKQTLTFRFDDAKNAGLPGTVILRTTGAARFSSVRLTPAAGQTVCAALTIHAEAPGAYAVRLAVVPNDTDKPWGESHLSVRRAGTARLELSLPLRAPRFEAGTPYDAPVIKLELYALKDEADKRGTLCDARTLTTGLPGHAPRFYLPLTKEECLQPPDELLSRAGEIGVNALFLPTAASALLYRRAAARGIALLPYAPGHTALPGYMVDSPCAFPIGAPQPLAFSPLSPCCACYHLCASPTAPASDPGMTPEELLFDAAGRHIDPDAPTTKDILLSLEALALRLRAEAARQGQFTGALCAPGQWRIPALFEAMRSAFSPLHLSALPLRGAWWTQSRFSASLHAFIPAGERTGAYAAEAELIDAQGVVLAKTTCDLPVCGGAAGFIEAKLPGESCVLTLVTRLRRSGAVVESCAIPVYVGLRGPLEAAFAQ